MMDVAVLLNLTDKLSFEVADPLMSVINAGKTLLFYDRLSVEPFPIDEARCQQHVERLASSMCNLLEARSLSTEDDKGRIRVIVTLDITRGAFQPEGSTLMFPAQKVRQLKKTIEGVFNDNHQLLDRFEYIFLFLSDQTSQGKFYQTLAYDGITGGGSVDWFCRDDLKLNDTRTSILNKAETPHAEWQLTHANFKSSFSQFNTELDRTLKLVADRMEKAGLRNEFEDLIKQKLNDITTVGDFSQFDYDYAISTTVCQLIGLSAQEFKTNCTFFIIHTDNTTIKMKLRCQAFIASLVQFLTTLDYNDYDRILKASAVNSSARLFIMSSMPDDDCMNDNDFSQLKQMVEQCLPCLENARWKYDQTVSYFHYSPGAEDPTTLDSHLQINDKFAQQRQQMFQDFLATRQVPFFFGTKIGDWNWYKRVLKSAVGIFNFETVNDRPLYDLPNRITDNEMEQQVMESSYTELENAINVLSKDIPEVNKGKDINEYLKERNKQLEVFRQTIETLKNEMVKLGYYKCLLWIGILSLLGFTLNFAFHFFGYGNTDNPLWIVACFGIASLLFVLAAVFGRAKIKADIEEVYSEMDRCYNQLQDNLKEYLDGIAQRIRQQNAADIRRKNLDEMKSKLDAFSRHNKQVDLWVGHFKDIVKKLSADNVPDAAEKATMTLNEKDFDMEHSMPSLPDVITNQFKDKDVKFTVQGTEINHVTSFVSHFKFVEEDQH